MTDCSLSHGSLLPRPCEHRDDFDLCCRASNVASLTISTAFFSDDIPKI